MKEKPFYIESEIQKVKEEKKMKLLFRQRMFSWFDSYDIYDENENTIYVVKGQLSWGHCLRIFDACDREVGTVKEIFFVEVT